MACDSARRNAADMTEDDKKHAVALAALEYVPVGEVIGIGTGTTANHFIAALKGLRHRIDGAVASSEASAALLRAAGIRTFDLNSVSTLALYVDGADEATRARQLIKGGGGALTREKLTAEVSERFVCIVDDSKLVRRLGRFPLPIEVLPAARAHVAREMVKRNARPVLREGFRTDNGNPILDVHDLDLRAPADLERELNQIPGTLANGIFARRPADVLLVADDEGVDRL